MEYPVKKGQQMIVEIERGGDMGRGVAVISGLSVFVDQAMLGERVEVEIMETQPRFATARTLRVLNAAPGRTHPPCPVYGDCGGCSMQFMDYQTHLDALVDNVRQIFKRIGGMDNVNLLPPLAMEEPWHYRNKAVYHAGGTAAAPRLGFTRRGTHEIVDVTDCPLQTQQAATAAACVLDWMRAHRVAPYDASERKGMVRHLMVRTNQRDETMVVLVTAGTDLPAKAALIAALQAALPGLRSVIQNINPRVTQEILGTKSIVVFGDERLEDELMGRKFSLSPLSFYQVNRRMTQRLYDQAVQFADLTGGETVVDAYCGAGTIGLALADKAQSIIGIELVADAVQDAQQNAIANGITNAQFLHGACEHVLPKLVQDGLAPDVVVLDPPRRGCDEKVLVAVAQSAPARIVYVSCNPATLARDVKRLGVLGYELASLVPVDMFPWTGEMEMVALLQ